MYITTLCDDCRVIKVPYITFYKLFDTYYLCIFLLRASELWWSSWGGGGVQGRRLRNQGSRDRRGEGRALMEGEGSDRKWQSLGGDLSKGGVC